jgi:hypothetical protein
MMQRLVVVDLFSGPGWRDASDMVGHLRSGESGGWLLIEPLSIRVLPGAPGDTQQLRDEAGGGPSFYCHTWYTTGGPDHPTVHTVAVGDADLYEEILLSIGFQLEQPEGIELQKDESGVYWGYYV